MFRTVCRPVLAALAMVVATPAAAPAHPGRAIVVDRQGRIYFVDTIRDRLWRLAPEGGLTLVSEGVHTDRLVFPSNGAVRPAEEYLRLLSRRAESAARDDTGLRVALANDACVFQSFVDRDGNAYCRVAGRLVRIDSAGTVTTLAADAALEAIETGIVTSDGTVYVADRRKILRLGLDGSLTRFAGSDSAGFVDGRAPAARFAMVLAIAADSAGNLFAVDYGNARIRRIAPDGAVTTVASAPWPWKPTGITVAPDAAVYVLERRFAYGALMGALVTGWVADVLGTPRVRRIAPDGSVATVAMVGGSPRTGLVLLAVLAVLSAVIVWCGRWLARRLRPREP